MLFPNPPRHPSAVAWISFAKRAKGRKSQRVRAAPFLPFLFCSKPGKMGIRATQSWCPSGRDLIPEPSSRQN